MTHPLLTKELADALGTSPEQPLVAAAVVARMPHADRLEAALDVCQYEGCTQPADRAWHAPAYGTHPFVPLVTL